MGYWLWTSRISRSVYEGFKIFELVEEQSGGFVFV